MAHLTDDNSPAQRLVKALAAADPADVARLRRQLGITRIHELEGQVASLRGDLTKAMAIVETMPRPRPAHKDNQSDNGHN